MHGNECVVCGATPTYKHSPLLLCSPHCERFEEGQFHTINGIVNWLKGRALSSAAGSRMQEASLFSEIAQDIKRKEWEKY